MTIVSTWRSRVGLAAILASAALGLALVLGSAPSAGAQAAPASAAIKQITLTPGEEVPPVTANAVGYFNGTLMDGKLEFDLSAVAPEITMAHIHLGAKGANGPVVAFLFGPVDPGVGAIHPTGTITQANLVGPVAGNWKAFTDAMAKGDLYVNVHSKANPAGVVRGQIPATTLAPLPPRTGTGPAEGEFGAAQGAGVLLLAASGGMLLLVVARKRA